MAKCRECGGPMTGGACATCAPSKPLSASMDRPANAVDELTRAMRAWQQAGKPWPSQLPADPLAAAKRWIEIQQPRTSGEVARRVSIAGADDKTRWTDNYVDRLRATFWKFAGPEVSETFRNWIVAAATERVWWRGDDEAMFGRIIEETLAYRENPAQYRNQAAACARRVLQGLKQSTGAK